MTAANQTITKTHISLNVSDVTKSVAFYEAFFGVPAHKVRTGYANFDLETPALKLALNESGAGVGGPLNHLGIVVESTEAVAAARQRLGAAGLISLDEGDTVCCHARQDKVWATDPDGNAWEVYTILDDMQDGAFEAPPSETKSVGCCTPKARGQSLSMAKTSGGCDCS
ncbi:ArsI/CadI family heavy metal resistance metalloenzyme [Armatimonas sp.]|uniref:ArsI/CadI family heavy metal resistance metalloenzyme n=1 Tax=Armatimonas sp. TaxID=1872638 RepID=UPI00286AA873|nr:ArsI/CadI family heavy metal resistance metalloenzyme [Armatimonas sp.]